MALGTIIIGAAAIAAAIWGSGCGERVPLKKEEKDPCDSVDCSGHGTCIPIEDRFVCHCDRGYFDEGAQCLPDEISDGDFDADSVENDTDAEDVEAETEIADADGEDDDQFEEEDVPRNPYCATQYCLNATSYFCESKLGDKVIECVEEEYCDEGMCVLRPDEEDPNCAPGMRSACEVTDEFDIPMLGAADQSQSRSHAYSVVGCWHSSAFQLDGQYQCSDDAADVLKGMYYIGQEGAIVESWMAMTMQVIPPPEKSFYRVDAKMDWMTIYPDACDENYPPALMTFFGDEQSSLLSYEESWKRCLYQTVGEFSAAGIDGDAVRLRFQNHGDNCDGRNIQINGLAIARTRIWSCECVEDPGR